MTATRVKIVIEADGKQVAKSVALFDVADRRDVAVLAAGSKDVIDSLSALLIDRVGL